MINPPPRGCPATQQQADGRKKRDPPADPSKRNPIKFQHTPGNTPHDPVKDKNRERNRRRAARRRDQKRKNQLRILQQNTAGLNSQKVELLKRMQEVKVDVAAIQEANFSIETIGGIDYLWSSINSVRTFFPFTSNITKTRSGVRNGDYQR